MRITTQMLNASMRKAGLPISNVSLLNYINGSSSQSNSLLNALNKNGIKVNNKDYEKLKSLAESLQESAEKVSAEDARTSGDKEPVYNNAQEMVKNYNSTIKAMKNTSSPLNQFYRQMLGDVAEESEDKLKEIGITKAADGTLRIDKEKLTAADVDKLEEVLGADGSFSSRISFLANRIADNAKANAASASSQYNALGNNYFVAASKYDFWG